MSEGGEEAFLVVSDEVVDSCRDDDGGEVLSEFYGDDAGVG